MGLMEILPAGMNLSGWWVDIKNSMTNYGYAHLKICKYSMLDVLFNRLVGLMVTLPA